MTDSISRTLKRLQLSDEALFRLNKQLSTFGGTDKALMLLQYLPLVLIPFLPPTANGKLPIQPRGLQRLRASLQALSLTVGDSRILFRLFGLIPILAWYRQTRRTTKQQQQTRGEAQPADGQSSFTRLLTPERVESFQIWSMFAYYPMEHLWYLAHKGVLPLQPSKAGKIAVWSCRAWAIYVFLSLYSLYSTRSDLQRTAGDDQAAKEKRTTWSLKAITDLSYLPLTAHWSLKSGLWSSPFYTGLFGTVAAVAQLQQGWRATAPPAVTSEAEGIEGQGNEREKAD